MIKSTVKIQTHLHIVILQTQNANGSEIRLIKLIFRPKSYQSEAILNYGTETGQYSN